jgi:hypothetical protein
MPEAGGIARERPIVGEACEIGIEIENAGIHLEFSFLNVARVTAFTQEHANSLLPIAAALG